MDISQSASTAFGHQQSLPVPGDLADGIAGLFFDNDSTQWHPHDNVFTTFTGHVTPGAALPVLRLVLSQVPKIHQRVQAGIPFQENTSSTASITAIGAAELDILLAPERRGAVSAVAGDYGDMGFINKFHGRILNRVAFANEFAPTKNPAGAGFFVKTFPGFRKFQY